MSSSLARLASVLAITLVATYFGSGCVIYHASCLPAPEVIDTNYPHITLASLTSAAPGRNVTLTTHEDRITATIEPLGTGAQQMEVRLVAGPNVTWWKAVEIRQGSGGGASCFVRLPAQRLYMAETQDQRNTASVLLRNDLAPRSSLVFWKGKIGQVHTAMYQLSGSLSALQGQRLTITWEAD